MAKRRDSARGFRGSFGAAIVAICSCWGPAPAHAAYTLGWYATDASATPASTGGVYSVRGAIGSPVTGPATGGIFALLGGAWLGGGSATTAVGEGTAVVSPAAFALAEPAPNPLTSHAVIAFDLAAPRFVVLRIVDLSGRIERALAAEDLPAGHHHRNWDGLSDDGRHAPPGVYFVMLDAGAVHLRRKVVVLR
jgi:hypothetical protein